MADAFDPAEPPDPTKLRVTPGAPPVRAERKGRRSLIGAMAMPPLAPPVPTGIEAPARLSPAPATERAALPPLEGVPAALASPTLVPEHIDELLAGAGVEPTPPQPPAVVAAPVAATELPAAFGPSEASQAGDSLPPMPSLPPMGDDAEIQWAETPKRSFLPWVLAAVAVFVFVAGAGLVGLSALVRTLSERTTVAEPAPVPRVERLSSPTPAMVEPLPAPVPPAPAPAVVEAPAPAVTVAPPVPAPAPPAPAAAVKPKPKAKAPPPPAVIAPAPAPNDDDPWGSASPAPAPAPAPAGDDPWGG